VGTGIDMNGIGRHIKMRKGVVIEMTMGFENIPFGLTDSVSTLPFVDSSKIERTVNECVRMSKVDIFSKRKEFVVRGVGNQMSQ
jgi:hypothetical protein